MPVPDHNLRTTIRGPGAQWTLLAMWGVLLGLSFPRPNLYVLAYFALVPLALLAVRGEPLRRVAVFTYLAGFLWWVVMIYWMMPVTGPGHIALAAYLGLYPLAFVLALRLIHRRLPVPMTLSVPIVWVAAEYARGIIMTGFPWFLIGHSQPTVMIQIADLFGAYGVSFLVAMTNGLIADLLTRPLFRRRRSGRPQLAPTVRLILPLWLIALVGTIGYGAYRILEFNPDDSPASIRVAVIQTNIPQDNKVHRTEEQDAENFREMIRLSTRAMGHDPPPHLIVLPETMVPRAINDEAVEVFSRAPGVTWERYRAELDRFVEDHDVAMVAGAHAHVGWQLDGEYPRAAYRYNSAYLMEPGNGIAARYDKVHRVPFGEYIPFVDTLGWDWLRNLAIRLTPYDHDYTLTPGRDWTAFDLNVGEGWTAAAPICFEDVVSYVPRRMVWDAGEKRVALLLNISNDGWFAGSAEGPQHEQIARFRSVENRVPMARAVNTGVSGFIDSTGRIIEPVRVDGRRQRVAGAAIAELHRDDRRTLFARTGDALAAASAGLTVLLLGLAAWRRTSA